jgi:ribosomal protein S18 acetylase RimI-like enzyme
VIQQTTLYTDTLVHQGATKKLEIDYSVPIEDDFGALNRDRIPVRSMKESDLGALIAIDRHATGRDRAPYYQRKVDEVLQESGVRVSLVAEIDNHPVGFIMARVDFGEFGRTDPEAVIDTIGVHPDYAHRGAGLALMSQLMANLTTLRVDRVRTQLDWNDVTLIAFLDRCGFKPSQRIAFVREIDVP